MELDTVKVIAGLLVSLVLPFVAEYLNKLFKLDGPKALAVAGVLAALFSLGSLAVTGLLQGNLAETFNAKNLVVLFGIIYPLSQTEFQLIKTKLGWVGNDNSFSG